MFIIDASQISDLDFDVVLEGVGLETLEFWLRMSIDEVSYGFPGDCTKDGKIRVTVPKLEDLVPNLDNNKTYDAKLEIIGLNEHYYLNPWKEKFQIKIKPKAKVTEAKIEHKKQGIKVSSVSVGIKEIPKKEENKKSKTIKANTIETMNENKVEKTLAKSTILALEKAFKKDK